MNFESEAPGQLGTMANALPLGLHGRRPVIGHRVAPRAGMNFDHRRADGDRRLDLPRLGGDEQRDADAGVPQPGDNRSKHVVLAGHI